MSSSRTRWGSVLALMAIAPWMAEMSWGGIPFTDALLVLVFLGPMYGGAALLIRETARRTGRGWPTVILLGAAFGVLQAGVVDQSLFNPEFARYDFQHPVHLDGLDVSLYYVVAFVTGHAVASITVPIVLAEGWSRRPTAPWLSRRGLWVVAVLYALATLVNHLGVKDEDGHGFQASALQVSVAVATAGVLAAAALLWPRRRASTVRTPATWVVALWGFAAYLLYLPDESGGALVIGVAVIGATCVVVGRWSRGPGWTPDHAFWCAMGAALTGVVVPYLAEPYDVDVSAARELVDDTVAAAICLALVASTAMRRRHIGRSATAGP